MKKHRKQTKKTRRREQVTFITKASNRQYQKQQQNIYKIKYSKEIKTRRFENTSINIKKKKKINKENIKTNEITRATTKEKLQRFLTIGFQLQCNLLSLSLDNNNKKDNEQRHYKQNIECSTLFDFIYSSKKNK